MSLFQQSVLKKHLQSLDKAAVEAAWQRYAGHFLDIAKQENIRNSKEEQYQEGFLRELFVDVLGYVLNPSPGFNLTTELKNVGNAKKADGGIVQGEKVLGVIELKGTDTVDLAKVEPQAFGYKSQQRDCRYVIIANFERLRLYVDDATEHEEFDLFELSPDRFRLLYLLLSADYLFADMPARIKQESDAQEKDITNRFYKEYSAFKQALFEDLVRRNPPLTPKGEPTDAQAVLPLTPKGEPTDAQAVLPLTPKGEPTDAQAVLPLTPKGEPTDVQASELQNFGSPGELTGLGSPLGVRGNTDGSPDELTGLGSPLGVRGNTDGSSDELTGLGSPLGVRGNTDGSPGELTGLGSPLGLGGLAQANGEGRGWHLLLFKKSQKLLDRLLFIFFGEDKGLLPPNLIKKTIDDWDRLRELDEYRPLYDQFKKYFQYINEGTERKDLSIFAYNGGLFEPDEVLDSVKISDPVLYKYTLELSRYDFDEQVDVNILGHIFEHSLNEIEEISAQLDGTDFDKTQTKRKKDGVFYTPRYITQYIVENTVGRLCTERKAALGIVEEDFARERKRTKKGQFSTADNKAVKELADRLDAYQQWLFELKICDPACGSGAFLNEAFDFLIREHGYVAQLRKHLFAETIPFSVENSILERNIYGVDINEEAVEIARLSLWLRSAEPGRKLTSLSGHIKVGNSLIDDPAVAGEKAFDWEKEFPEVFPQKDLQAFHVVLTTHNSRTSQRMIQYRVQKGPALWFIPEHELLITQLIGDVIKDYGFRCMEYMVCADHVHMVLVCEPEELTDVVRTIKSISARKFNLATGRTIPASPSSPPPALPHPRGLDTPRGHDIPRGLAPLPADTSLPTNAPLPNDDPTSSDDLGAVGARGQAPLERQAPLDRGTSMESISERMSYDGDLSSPTAPPHPRGLDTPRGLAPLPTDTPSPADIPSPNNPKLTDDLGAVGARGLAPLERQAPLDRGTSMESISERVSYDGDLSLPTGLPHPRGLDTPRGLAPLPTDTLLPADIPSPNNPKLTDDLGAVGARGQAPLDRQAPLEREVHGDAPTKPEKTPSVPVWSQKFYRADLDVWELATVPTKPGYWQDSTHLDNAENYIRTNRQKHGLPEVKGLDALIRSFTCTREEAFAPQYKGGFDVVVGNPPYVRQEVISPFKPFFEKAYKTYHGSADLFVYFIEKGITMLKPEGLYSIIVANKWMRANYGKPLRQWLKQRQLVEIVDFGDLPVFADATAYPCVLTVSPKALAENHQFSVTEPTDLSFPSLEQYVKENQFAVSQNGLDDEGWALVNNVKSALLDKIKNTGITLKEYINGKIYLGVKTGLNEAFVIDGKKREELIRLNSRSQELIRPLVAGKDIKRYLPDFDEKYLIRIPNGWTNKNRGTNEPWEFLLNTYPAIAHHLLPLKEQAEKRGDKGEYWWELRPCDYYDEFEKPKLILPDISLRGNFAFDKAGKYYSLNTGYIIATSSIYLLAILNSKLITFYYQNLSPSIRGGYLRFFIQYLFQLPIPECKDDSIKLRLEELALILSNKYEEEKSLTTQFTRLLRRRFDVEQLPQKLEAWHELDYKAFCAELNKLLQKVHKRKLSIQEDLEWEPLFEEQRGKAAALQADIQRVDREIDGVVYGLYGLGAEEVRIVEDSS